MNEINSGVLSDDEKKFVHKNDDILDAGNSSSSFAKSKSLARHKIQFDATNKTLTYSISPKKRKGSEDSGCSGGVDTLSVITTDLDQDDGPCNTRVATQTAKVQNLPIDESSSDKISTDGCQDPARFIQQNRKFATSKIEGQTLLEEVFPTDYEVSEEGKMQYLQIS